MVVVVMLGLEQFSCHFFGVISQQSRTGTITNTRNTCSYIDHQNDTEEDQQR